MLYKDFQDLKLSALGLGMMRLPKNGSGDGDIDEAKAAEMVDYALKNGVNYFDTAYAYHGGQSEIVTGRILGRYPRDSYYLASKFPGYDVANIERAPEIFEEQLKKCGVEYFDFYLLHNVCEDTVDGYLDEDKGLMKYLLAQKQAGRIRHLGFSCHGNYNTLKRVLDTYGEYLEFCQIQLNYMDWHYQDAKARVELLNQRGVPIWVMEPLRGGKLANLPRSVAEKLRSLRPDESVPGWALRFQQSVPGVAVVLSGMSNMQQLQENIAIFSEERPLSQQEFDAVVSVADGMTAGGVLPCTACRYCTTRCPAHLDIPALLSLYNEYRFSGDASVLQEVSAMPREKSPAACIACRSCEGICPQKIKVSETMAGFASSAGLR